MDIKASEFKHKDFISNMPDDLVTHILDRLPLQDAVRTNVLSKKWRFKWTMLSQLIFDEKFFMYLIKRHRCYGRIINSLLLHHKGVITKFELSTDKHAFSMLGFPDEPDCYKYGDLVDIEHWILFLSRNGIKDLTFEKWFGPPVMLPATYIFSCLELKHLKLVNCVITLPAYFHGFPNLLSLELDLELSESSQLGKFISKCPLLEVLNIRFRPFCVHNISSKGRVKLVEFAKLTNLEILSLSLCQLDDTKITSSSCIFELLGVLPKLQKLDFDFLKFKFIEGGAKKRPPTVFLCLKDLRLSRIDLGNDIMLSCAFDLIKCFPNLQTLEITAEDYDAAPAPEIRSPEVVDYNTMELLELRSVEFRDLRGSENEVCLIKHLLACSPFLKKLDIRPLKKYNEKLVFVKKVLNLHRASPVVDIDLH